MNPADRLATRAALLELGEERRVVAEAYAFLDEKRLLLAAELLRQLERYQQLLEAIREPRDVARRTLTAAVQRHGLQELSVCPATSREGTDIEVQQRNVMGVTLTETAVQLPVGGASRAPWQPSPEAEQCRAAFSALLPGLTALAGVSGNLYRLLDEYRRTERRARALENVILPELHQALARMTAQLEEAELEDAIRVRLKAGNSPA